MRKIRKEVKERESNLAETVDRLSLQLQGGGSNQQEQSESAQAIKEINKDERDRDGFSTLDQLSDLTHDQVNVTTKLESLSRMWFFTGKAPDEQVDEFIDTDDGVVILTRTFQRKQVSKNRKGRHEAIEMFQQIESKKESKGFWEKWFSPKE